MKRFTNILVALGVTLFLLTVGMKSEAEAQPPTECDSDPCYQSQPWIDHVKQYTYGIQPACSNCWVKIYYKTRAKSTNPNCLSLPAVEYKFSFILVSGSCYFPPCSNFTPFDMEQAYQEAMTSLLLELGYGPISPSDCGTVFKNYTITNCFREDFDTEGNKILRLCNTFTCCKQDLQLCLENGNLKISSIKTETTGDCGNDPYHPLECKTICNWVDDAIVPKRVLDDKFKSELNPLKVYPNPISTTTLFFDFTNETKISSISIITTDGKIVEVNKNMISDDKLINIESFSNGNYILILKDNNGINYYSQFIINK